MPALPAGTVLAAAAFTPAAPWPDGDVRRADAPLDDWAERLTGLALPGCVLRWLVQCIVGGTPICSEEDWSDAPGHCKRSTRGRPPRICEASGLPFPPSNAAQGWDSVWRQWQQCEDTIWGTRYAEVRWDPEHFVAELPWARRAGPLPPSFGLCFSDEHCTSGEAERFLVPLYWLWRLDPELLYDPRNAKGDGGVMRLLQSRLPPISDNEAPGRPRLAYGNHHKMAVYRRAMHERALGWPGRRGSAAACIVGMPRTFAWPEVHGSLRRNVLEALNFEDMLHIYVLHMDRPKQVYYASRRWHNSEKQRGLGELMEAFSAIPPHVLVTEPMDVEGHPPHRECNKTWGFSCNAQGRGLELCLAQIRVVESVRGAKFDWILRIRPDLLFNGSMGDIRAYSPTRIHLRKPHYSDTDDRFALVPRQFADVYFGARLSAASDFCWVTSVRGFVTGDCEFRLQEHLRRSKVLVEPLPLGLFFTARESRGGTYMSNRSLANDLLRWTVELPPREQPVE